ncbi:hypothetical protein Dimus_000463 [Dionaea muscipula]
MERQSGIENQKMEEGRMMKKMKKKKKVDEKRSPIHMIKKRLQDLELELNDSHVDESSEQNNDQLMITAAAASQAMHHKFAFLKSLLSAEIASNHHHQHHRLLARIADRVESLESAFLDPRDLLLASADDHDAVANPTTSAVANSSSITTVNERNDDDQDVHGTEDADCSGGSTCSCTESCRNDEGGEEENVGDYSSNGVLAGFSMYVNPVFEAADQYQRNAHALQVEDENQNKDKDKAKANDDDEDENEGWNSRCYWKGMASGVVVGSMAMGMVMMLMIMLSGGGGFDYFVDQQPHFSLPPT